MYCVVLLCCVVVLCCICCVVLLCHLLGREKLCTMAVQVFHAAHNLADDVSSVPLGVLSPLTDAVEQVQPVRHKFHHEMDLVVVLMHFIQFDYVRMAQVLKDACLPSEMLEVHRLEVRLPHLLDGKPFACRDLLCFKDCRKSSPTGFL